MQNELKYKIEDYLEQNDLWKMFINEQGTDFENAVLNGLDVTVGKLNKSNCEFSVDISYNNLENEDNVHGNGIVFFSIVNNEIEINNINKIN